MSLDSVYSYMHMDDPNRVLYMQLWQLDSQIAFDEIDTQSLTEATMHLFPLSYLQQEEEDGGIILVNNTNFSSNSKFRQNHQRERIWQDIDVSFLEVGRANTGDLHQTTEANQRTDSGLPFQLEDSAGLEPRPAPHDRTLLTPMHDVDLGAFLANGYQVPSAREPVLAVSPPQFNFLLDDANEFPTPSVGHVSSVGNNRNSSAVIQTPRIARVRQSSTDRNFQTPIARIVR